MTRTILLLAANPKGTSHLRLDQEVRDIDEGLRRSQHRDQFILKQIWAVRPRDIQRAMLDNKPQVIHFSGHGMGEQGLVFEDESGQPQFVSSKALASLFKLFAQQLECVVLNGCYSQAQAEAIAQYIPYVIGMNQAIGDKAAIEFAVGFYDALTAGETVEFAYELGCAAIQLAGIHEELTPVLVMRQGVGTQSVVLQTPTPQSQPITSQSLVSPKDSPIEVFFSYSRKDESLKGELVTHLSLLKRQEIISAWHDREISAGTEWANAIDEHMETANIILLLISANFLNSDYCYDIELKRAMERHEAGEARVVPIILKPVDWKGALFGKLQALPKNAKPIATWGDKDEAFLNVVQGLRRVLEELKSSHS